MRIQHNITAMNSYRNFTINNSALSKNLEKLSSGYKVNRAGDDAAGLAISEKMRAQITGLEGATKNAKDGISLIQTAEGALTEVHSMLNRMTSLAEQSANGTYDNDVDRAQLQKEVASLKEEIDRIADSANFNGLKLLDGSLSGGSNVSGAVTLSSTEASKTMTTMDAFDSKAGAMRGDKISYTVRWTENGQEKSETLDFTVKYDSTSSTFKLVAEDGTEYAVTGTSAQGTATNKEDYSVTVNAADITAAVKGEFLKNSALNAAFKLTDTSNALTFESKTEGSKGAKLINVDTQITYGEFNTAKTKGDSEKLGGSTMLSTALGLDVDQVLNFDNLKVLDGTDTNYTGKTLKEIVDLNTFVIDGKKFVLFAGSKNNDLNKLKEAAGSDVTFIQLGTTNQSKTNAAYEAATDKADATTIAAELSRVTGRNFGIVQIDGDGKPSASGKWQVVLKDSDWLQRTGKSLELQIGDTADSWNKMAVTVRDMHAAALGIGDIDISTQDGASDAMQKIKDAINDVSDTRGGLGALQNRLDHTINNLGVMRENIQNAESLIRDTDVAEEMMAYTKNSILNQSAQAMLAQANQLPQGVLQLLG